MKMLLFVLCIITYTCCAVEYKYNETDKFTKSVKFKTKPLVILKRIEPFPKTVHKDIGVSVKHQDSMNVMCIEYVMWKGSKMILNSAAGNSVTLLLEDGSSINLPVMGILPNYIEYTVEHEFYVDEINTEILKNKKITDMRFNAQINGYDLSVPEPKREELRELIKLFPAAKKVNDTEKNVVKDGPGNI